MARGNDRYYAAWATAWGPVGGVWSDAGLSRVVLPHYSMDDLLALLAWEHPSAERDEKPFAEFVERSRAWFNGRRVSFDDIPCDLPGERSFSGMVLRAARDIPYGETRSYSQLAKAIERPDAARAVATALSKNPTPLVVPCHRVTYADGRAGGFSAAGGPDLKQRMIAMESS